MPRPTLEMEAGQVMERDVKTLRPDMPVREAIEISRRYPHSTYPVLDDQKHLLGVIQREDFHEFLRGPGGKPEARMENIPFVSLPTVQSSTRVVRVMEKIIRGAQTRHW